MFNVGYFGVFLYFCAEDSPSNKYPVSTNDRNN